MTDTLNDIQILIDDFNKLKIKERSGSTFLEIAKCPHLENVWSNILAFYINPNNEHNLHELILKSIFESLSESVTLSNLKEIRVETEHRTKEDNRIDIMVFSDNFILGIENKVEANLDNPLSDYSKRIDDIANQKDLQTFKVVLSKYPNSTTDGFVNLIYTDLIKAIRQNIGSYSDFSDTKYLIFLLDFLKNIETNINSESMGDNQEVINFLLKNAEKIKKLLDYNRKFELEFERKLDEIDNLIDTKCVEDLLFDIEKKTELIGRPSRKGGGRFSYMGRELIKYNLKIDELSLFYQVGYAEYKLHSHYWFADSKHQPFTVDLKKKGIDRTEYDYNETAEGIAEKITDQLKEIIREIIGLI